MPERYRADVCQETIQCPFGGVARTRDRPKNDHLGPAIGRECQNCVSPEPRDGMRELSLDVGSLRQFQQVHEVTRRGIRVDRVQFQFRAPADN